MRTAVACLDGECVIPRVEAATSLRDRMRGLLGRHELPSGTAMLLSPCGSVHTVGMRFAIDVVFLDRGYRVVKVCRDVAPYRLAWGGFRACHALEAQTGWLNTEPMRHGAVLEFRYF